MESRRSRLAIAVAVVATVGSACKKESIIYVTVDAEADVMGVVRLEVTTENQGETDDSTFEDGGAVIDFPTTFTLGLPTDRNGAFTVTVTGVNAAGDPVGEGSASGNLVVDGRVDVTVVLTTGGVEDMDGDMVMDDEDNCLAVPNTDQADGDDDGVGDVCDLCPADADPTNADGDTDGAGDACDNCPAAANSSQSDCDADGEGDACDATCACCVDTDMDGVPDVDDNCPMDTNPTQDDGDGDVVGDACDNCPAVSNAGQADTIPAAGDGVGDACGDFDADLVGDLDDCAPENGAVFPGNVDLCDGVEADCRLGICSLDAAGMAPRGVAAEADTFVVSLDGAAGMGEVRFLDGLDAAALFPPVALADPRGIAINPMGTGGLDRAYIAELSTGAIEDRRIDTGADPTGLNTISIAGLGQAVVISVFGELGFAARSSAAEVVFFSPLNFEIANDPLLNTLSLTAAPLSLPTSERAVAMAVRQALTGSGPQLWLVFETDGRVAQVNTDTAGFVTAGATGFLASQPALHARSLLYAGSNVLLVGAYDDETSAGTVSVYTVSMAAPTAANTALVAETAVPPVVGAACPAGLALSLTGTTLYVADWCNDRIVEASLSGTMLDFGATVTETPVCEGPFALAVASNGAGGETLLVLCDGGPGGGPAGLTVLGLD